MGDVQIYVTLEAGEQLQTSLSNLTIDCQNTQDDSVLNAQFSAQAGNEIYTNRGQISKALAEDARATFIQFCASMKQEALRQTGKTFLLYYGPELKIHPFSLIWKMANTACMRSSMIDSQ